MNESAIIEVPPGGAGQRLDAFLPGALGRSGVDVSRSAAQGWIRDGHVTVNGRLVKGRHALSEGDRIAVTVPDPEPDELVPEDIPLAILHEDEDVILIDKPAGLVVHPGSGNAGGTLVNALLHHCGGQLSRLADPDRPGIVHRLDKDTSGVMVAAKSDRAYTSLVAQFSGRETVKFYTAVVAGIPAEETGRIENRIGRHPVQRQRMSVVEDPAGKPAVTEYAVEGLSEPESWARLDCRIFTGRTHQIRVHCAQSLRCPILVDPIYGRSSRQKVKTGRLMLHARELGFHHPATGAQVRFISPEPAEFGAFPSRDSSS